MEIPADGILISGADITTDESSMTGETNPIKKDVFMKCQHIKNELTQSG